MLDEAERSLHDALCVLSQTGQDSRVIFGGGWAEMQASWGQNGTTQLRAGAGHMLAGCWWAAHSTHGDCWLLLVPIAAPGQPRVAGLLVLLPAG